MAAALVRTGARRCASAAFGISKPAVADLLLTASPGTKVAGQVLPSAPPSGALLPSAPPSGALLRPGYTVALLRPSTSAAGALHMFQTRRLMCSGNKPKTTLPIDEAKLAAMRDRVKKVDFEKMGDVEMQVDLQRQALYASWSALAVRHGGSDDIDAQSFAKAVVEALNFDAPDVATYAVSAIAPTITFLVLMVNQEKKVQGGNQAEEVTLLEQFKSWIKKQFTVAPPKKDPPQKD